MFWISSQFFNIISFVVFVQFQQWEVYLHARPRQSGTCTSFDRPPQCSLARTPRRIHKLLQMLLFICVICYSVFAAPRKHHIKSIDCCNLPAWIKCSLVLKTLINLPLSKLSVKLFILWFVQKSLIHLGWWSIPYLQARTSPALQELCRCIQTHRPRCCIGSTAIFRLI